MNRLKALLVSILTRWVSALSRENVENENQKPGEERQEANPEARNAPPIARTIIDVPQPILDEYRRNQKERSASERANRCAAAWAVAGAFLLAAVGIWQACLTRIANKQSADNFVATQRAAVYLGLPDGTIGGFSSDNSQVILQFRNYGASVAENTVIEIWPITFKADGIEHTLDIPPFQGFDHHGPYVPGVWIPPGAPYPKGAPISPDQAALVRAGQAILRVVIRTSYIDSLGTQACQAFLIQYDLASSFSLAATGNGELGKRLCDGRPHRMPFGAVAVGNKWTQVWPLKTARPLPGPHHHTTPDTANQQINSNGTLACPSQNRTAPSVVSGPAPLREGDRG